MEALSGKVIHDAGINSHTGRPTLHRKLRSSRRFSNRHRWLRP
jgi:hypothetical protein